MLETQLDTVHIVNLLRNGNDRPGSCGWIITELSGTIIGQPNIQAVCRVKIKMARDCLPYGPETLVFFKTVQQAGISSKAELYFLSKSNNRKKNNNDRYDGLFSQAV